MRKSELLLDLLSDAVKVNIMCSHKPAGPCCTTVCSLLWADRLPSSVCFDWGLNLFSICWQIQSHSKNKPPRLITTDLNKTTDNQLKMTEILSLNTHFPLPPSEWYWRICVGTRFDSKTYSGWRLKTCAESFPAMELNWMSRNEKHNDIWYG